MKVWVLVSRAADELDSMFVSAYSSKSRAQLAMQAELEEMAAEYMVEGDITDCCGETWGELEVGPGFLWNICETEVE